MPHAPVVDLFSFFFGDADDAADSIKANRAVRYQKDGSSLQEIYIFCVSSPARQHAIRSQKQVERHLCANEATACGRKQSSKGRNGERNKRNERSTRERDKEHEQATRVGKRGKENAINVPLVTALELLVFHLSLCLYSSLLGAQKLII